MPRFNVGNRLKPKTGEGNYEIIFVPPIDNYGVQHYLCKTNVLLESGIEKEVTSLKNEAEIEGKFLVY